MAKKLERFEVKEGDNTRKLALLQVTADIGRKALAEYNRAFSAAVKSGALLRTKLQSYMEEQEVWDEGKEEEYKKIVNRITDNKDRVDRGGIKLSQGFDYCIDTRKARIDLQNLIAERTSLDVNSAEGQAENARFNCLVSLCTIDDETGETVFKDLDDYLARAGDDVAIESATRLAAIMYGLDADFTKNLPENKWLKKWGFVDDKLRLVNKDGHLVDEDGRLINEDGRYVDGEGNFVDIDGNPVTEEGEPENVESLPFLDDEGNPLPDPDEPPKKKRGPKSKKEIE
jgi:hypothetical protein